MILYLDTETTGIRPGQIAQLSYIMQTNDSVRAKNFFFTVQSMEYGAYLVHHFSIEKLFNLSGGKVFGDFSDEILSDLESADCIVIHNSSFDLMFLREEFSRLGKIMQIKKEFCSMKKLTPVCKILRSNGVGYKYPKLSEACTFFGISDTEIKKDVCRFFGEDLEYHDARFDTTALFLVANHAMEYQLRALREYL